jgi:hypothetical protein
MAHGTSMGHHIDLCNSQGEMVFLHCVRRRSKDISTYAACHLSILDVPSRMLHFSKELWEEANMMRQGLSEDDCMITSFDAGNDEDCTMSTSLVDVDFPPANSLFAADCE